MVLFGLYGLSVPLSVYFELDIGWHRVAKLSTWQKPDRTLFSFMISNQLALLAIQVVSILFGKKKYMRLDNVKQPVVEKTVFLQLALLAGFLSSLSEGLNLIRAGGVDSMSKGKAFYQGAVNDLALNIPYEGFFFISVALMGLYLNSISNWLAKLEKILFYILSISVVLWVNMYIGERGLLVVALVILILALSFYKRYKSIKPSILFAGIVLYSLFTMLTLLREKTIKYNGFVPFFSEHGERMVRLMNPANTEFGASALNYRIYIDRKPQNNDFKWGATYTEVFWSFIPTYVYSNKPKSIIYQFRDNYFSERKKMGSSAGTGFSSLMEAHMNFGFSGSFITYFISSFFLIYMETRRGKSNLFGNLLYLLLFNIYLIYSRSASQYILFNLLMYVAQIIIVVVVYQLIPKNVFNFMLNEQKN